MAQIIWTEHAGKEYRSCLLYAKDEFGAKAAKRFYENVSKRTRRLEKYPETGFIEPLLTNRKENFRASIIQDNFKLIYHYIKEDEIVYIDDIWDMRRNPKTLAKRI
jgi:plasmid stabilization system protein ParE